MSVEDTALYRSSDEWSAVTPPPPVPLSGTPSPFPRNLLGNGPAQALLGGGPVRSPGAPGRPRRPSRRGALSGAVISGSPNGSGERGRSEAKTSGRPKAATVGGRSREKTAARSGRNQGSIPPAPASVAPGYAQAAPAVPRGVAAGYGEPVAAAAGGVAAGYGEPVAAAAGGVAAGYAGSLPPGSAPAGASSRPRHRQIRRPRPPRIALSQPVGPHVRLGILWAAATFVALWKGPDWAAAWLTPVAAMAAATAVRSWGTGAVAPPLAHNRRARVQPPAAVAALFSAAITVAALGGGQVMALVAASAALILIGATVFGPAGRPTLLARLALVVGPGLAAGSLVVARSQGLATGLVLAGMVALYDSSAYLIGSGAPNRWEGSVAGAASIAALTLMVAAVLAPPFTGASPWLFGIAAAVLAPVGVGICRRLTGDKDAPVPALRRLDSLILLGPVWVAAVAILLHR